MAREFDMYEEMDNILDYPKSLRCSDGAEVADTPRNWDRYLKDPDRFQDEYVARIKKWLGKSER